MGTPELVSFDESRHWRLSDHASLRDESFGALAYHHDTRRLVFLKSRRLVDLVRRLESYPCASDALDELVEAHERSHYHAALASLSASGLLRD